MKTNDHDENFSSRTARNTKHLAFWTGLWLLSLALVSFGPTLLWDYHKVITICTVVTNVVMGYKMIMANKQHLQGLDELQQRIQLEAMATSLGVSMVFGALFGLIEAIKLVSFTPNPSSILFVMGITYFITILVRSRTYS
ncbi:hypothetical protein ISG33_13715 [Glaciecola sp. MH2013]|uniref:hypothetical protein n=1 Tax=Glaciecola sp. MH2013 TaxID=2785524 RepID=UPI0018A095A1|nr:hypothetical protein [Glaciecola sp. MH2013]MBF7074458.1 hypothetical protein [Glaciecola sp. MH2013]